MLQVILQDREDKIKKVYEQETPNIHFLK